MDEMIKKTAHLIAHLLGVNTGRVETWWERKGQRDRLMTAFRCECGRRGLATESWMTRKNPPVFPKTEKP